MVHFEGDVLCAYTCLYNLQYSLLSAQQDAIFELVSMAFNVAIWYAKFASRLAGKEK